MTREAVPWQQADEVIGTLNAQIEQLGNENDKLRGRIEELEIALTDCADEARAGLRDYYTLDPSAILDRCAVLEKAVEQ